MVHTSGRSQSRTPELHTVHTACFYVSVMHATPYNTPHHAFFATIPSCKSTVHARLPHVVVLYVPLPTSYSPSSSSDATIPRGICGACVNRKTYTLLFDWLFPAHTNLLRKCMQVRRSLALRVLYSYILRVLYSLSCF